MAIAFDDAAYNAASGTSTSVSMTIASGGVLVCFVAFGGANTISTLTFDSVSLLTSGLILGVTDDSGGVEAQLAAYCLHNPTTGSSKTLALTATSGAGYVAVQGLSYTGVEASSSAAMHRTGYHSGSADVTVVDSQNGDKVVSGVCDYGTLGVAKRTSRASHSNFGGSAYDVVAQDYDATGASSTMGYTGPLEFWTEIAFSLIPAAAASGVAPNIIKAAQRVIPPTAYRIMKRRMPRFTGRFLRPVFN